METKHDEDMRTGSQEAAEAAHTRNCEHNPLVIDLAGAARATEVIDEQIQLLLHLRTELFRLAAEHPGPRPDLELLAIKVDVAIGGTPSDGWRERVKAAIESTLDGAS